MARLFCVAAFVPLASALTAGRADAIAAANPVRKVVTLLQKMQKIEAEGASAQDLYTKFMCYCRSSGGDLGASIAAAEAKLPSLAASLKASASRKQQLEDDLASHQKDRASAKTAVSEATANRTKEKSTYDKDLADNQANLAAVKKAATAISGGMGSFLQTVDAGMLRKFVAAKQDMSEVDRQELLSFLSGQQEGEYAPASGEIVGILATMADQMQAAQGELIATEEGGVKDFDGLLAAKKKELATLSGSIENKMARIGELGVEIATMKKDAADTAEGLGADKEFAADTAKKCSEQTAAHMKEKQLRAAEVVALADTIKILNDDDALDLFKNTLPSASASLVQVQKSTETLLTQATQVLTAARVRTESRHRPHLDFILLALNGKKANGRRPSKKAVTITFSPGTNVRIIKDFCKDTVKNAGAKCTEKETDAQSQYVIVKGTSKQLDSLCPNLPLVASTPRCDEKAM